MIQNLIQLRLVIAVMLMSIAHTVIPCPTHLCVCFKKERRAECSNRKLPFSIPKLPSYVENVEFNDDYFSRISKKTFESISQNRIIKISMRGSQIQHIGPNTFEDLIYLKTLDFSSNEDINITSLKISLYSLKNRNLSSLNFDRMGWKDLSMKVFSGVSRSIDTLSLSSNSFHQLSDGMFEGLKKLLTLHAFDNRLRSCSKSLKELKSLVTLGLSHNNIATCSSKVLPKTLKDLLLISNGMQRIPNFCLSNGFSHTPSLETLVLAGNIIRNISNDTLYCLTSLKILDLAKNNIQHVSSIGLPPRLEELYLSSNSMTEFPDFCSSNGTSNVPNLQKLELQDNNIVGITQRSFHCLPSLLTLNLGQNPLQQETSTFLSAITSLESLLLSEIKHPERIFGRAVFDIGSLKRFIFTRNRFVIPILKNCPNLEEVDLSNNDFSWMTTLDEEDFFGGLSKLKYIDHISLFGVYLNTIPNGFFKWFPNITGANLANNDIRNVQSGLFSESLKIKALSLASNRITHIGPDTFPQDFWKSIQHLDLSGNPFSCDCNLLWFRDKFKASPKIFLREYKISEKYECASPPERLGLQLRNFNLTSNDCKAKSNLLTILLSSGSICSVIFLSLLILYKGRWHIRYWIYLFRYKRSEYHRLVNTEFRFDAFVIYADTDSEFVHQTLLPKLEDDEGFRLCVHFRDFVVGKIIADNIVESMSESRMAIVVLSKHFCKSKWCKFELIIAQDRWLNNESDALLLVMLEDP